MTDPADMTPTQRAAELAEIDIQMRRLQRRAQALVAVNGRGLATAREDRRAGN